MFEEKYLMEWMGNEEAEIIKLDIFGWAGANRNKMIISGWYVAEGGWIYIEERVEHILKMAGRKSEEVEDM